jgi:hypothetical protein
MRKRANWKRRMDRWRANQVRGDVRREVEVEALLLRVVSA